MDATVADNQKLKLPLAVVLFGMVAIISAALAFEYAGYAPCQLCLEQRLPYYWGMPFVGAGLLAALFSLPACAARGALAIGFICLVATLLLGAYHSGVEWGVFAAPQSCGAGITGTSSDADSLLESLAAAKPPSCDEAAGRFLGISFANANVLGAGGLALYAFFALRK
ncbi:MAG: disulfide bond formation protein B [Pseudomonadota bacterium]